MMAADTMEALGIPRDQYVVKIWNRLLLDSTLDAIPVVDELKRLTVLRAIDKLDRLGVRGVQQLLGSGRRDESGDVTKGAGLSVSANNFVTYSLTTASLNLSYRSPELIAQSEIDKMERGDKPPFDVKIYRGKVMDYLDGRLPPPSLELGLNDLEAIQSLVSKSGYSDRIKIDPSVVRGLEYYTGPVFEVELMFSTDGKDGSPRFGSVGGGGRYDGLVSRFRGEPVPATGFSIGVSRLLAALQYLNKVETKAEAGPVVVTVFDKDRIADYQQMVASLRNAGIRAELYLGSGKFGPQMKYADRRNAPCVVIQGSDEKAKGEVTIKDLIVGSELAKLEKGREEHLQKQAEAQRAVPEAQLVEAVRAVLARHKLAPR